MNLRHVEFVIAAAAERSFSRAAARCEVSQPTLSNGIALMEQALGGQLFVRTTRRVGLSPFGEQMLPMIEALSRSHEELRAGARTFHDPAQQMIRIGLSPLADVRRVAESLEPFRRTHPACKAFFKECYLDDLDERLRAGHLDVAVRPQLRARPSSREKVAVTLYREELFYLSARTPAGPPEALEPVPLADIADDVFVLGPDGCGLAAFIRGLFRGAGLPLREYGGQALSYHVMQDWVDLGIGATILPASKLAAPFRSRARRILARPRTPAAIAFAVEWMPRGAHPRHVARLHRHFVEYLQAV